MIACPKCQVALIEESLLELRVDRCPTCRAIWFDAGELESLRTKLEDRATPKPSASESGFVPSAQTPRGACPTCAEATLEFGVLDGRELWRCVRCSGILVVEATVTGFQREAEHQDHDRGYAPNLMFVGDPQAAGIAYLIGWLLHRLFR